LYKSVQILAYAVDIDKTGRIQSATIEAFTSLEKAARSMNLLTDQENTKYRVIQNNCLGFNNFSYTIHLR